LIADHQVYLIFTQDVPLGATGECGWHHYMYLCLAQSRSTLSGRSGNTTLISPKT